MPKSAIRKGCSLFSFEELGGGDAGDFVKHAVEAGEAQAAVFGDGVEAPVGVGVHETLGFGDTEAVEPVAQLAVFRLL